MTPTTRPPRTRAARSWRRRTVDKAAPSISTQVAAASVALPNASLVDTATLSGATTRPAGDRDDHVPPVRPVRRTPRTATAAPRASSSTTKAVDVTNGNGSYVSPAVVVSTVGYYTWVATYSGDDNNLSATHACGQASETVKVRAPTRGGQVLQPAVRQLRPARARDRLLGQGLQHRRRRHHERAGLRQPAAVRDGGAGDDQRRRVLSADGKHIQWVVTLAPGGSKTFTYDVTVKATRRRARVLVNTARFRTSPTPRPTWCRPGP